jgi:hypothetical protein
MNEKSMDNVSKTDWAKVDAITEAEIDTSDIPPLTKSFFAKSRWWKPKDSLTFYVDHESK